MTKADKTLDKMRTSPHDWRIEDLEVVAKRHGLMVRKPGGSHAIVQKQGVALEVSVPAHKPIKPIYSTPIQVVEFSPPWIRRGGA